MQIQPLAQAMSLQKSLLKCRGDRQFSSCPGTLSLDCFSHPPSLISKGHVSPFTALTWNNDLYTTLAGEVYAYRYLFCLLFHS